MSRSFRRALVLVVAMAGACATPHVPLTPGASPIQPPRGADAGVVGPGAADRAENQIDETGQVLAMTALVCMIPLWVAFAVGMVKLVKASH